MKINKKYVSASMMALGILTLSSMVVTKVSAADLGVTVHMDPGANMTNMNGSMIPRMESDFKATAAINNPNRVAGTVTAIDGTTLTVQSNGTAYTVVTTNAKIYKNTTVTTISGIAVGDTIVAEGPKTNTTITAKVIHDGAMMKVAPGQPGEIGIAGTVTAVNGTTITVSGKNKSDAPTVVYTINAASATVKKDDVASTVSGIAVGDMVRIEGTVSGTTVTATIIVDGRTPAPSMPQGNGQPIVGGTVTAVSGNTITITNKSNVSYTIDATSATFIKNGAVGTLSSIAVGDSIVAQGTVNGTSVTAVSVTDQGAVQTSTTPGPKGFFGSVGSFFAHLFGF
jgi:hypothetical protein